MEYQMKKWTDKWSYTPFETLFGWKEKSHIKSSDGKQTGKYKMFVCSDTEIKRFNEYLESGESLVFGTGGKASCHFVDEEFSYSTDCVVAQKKSTNICTKFYYYYLRQNKLSLIQNTFAGSGLQHTSKKKIGALQVPIITFDEQERIVARIEEIFSNLDNGVETLKRTKQQLTVYRQAVLKEAFEGRLTEAERLGTSTLKAYIEKPRYGTSKKCDYVHSENSMEVYRIPNIDHATGKISHQDIKYAKFSKDEIEQIKLKCGDILIIRSNGSVSLVGRSALIREIDTKGTFAGYLMRLRIKDKSSLMPEFLLYYLQSHEARMYIENKAKSTNGVHNINSAEICSVKIPVFQADDQRRIVAAIESRLSVCDSIEKTVDTALQQAEVLRQSILKKAFEGGM